MKQVTLKYKSKNSQILKTRRDVSKSEPGKDLAKRRMLMNHQVFKPESAITLMKDANANKASNF